MTIHLPHNRDQSDGSKHCQSYTPAQHHNTHSKMAAAQKLYPRGTVKRIVKAHSNRSVSKNADILVRSRPSPLLSTALPSRVALR